MPITNWFNRKKCNTVVIPPVWIRVKDQLPPLFKSVIVWGVRKTENRLPQAWQARRWTSITPTKDFDIERDKLWIWITPSDKNVEEVTHWMAMPETVICNRR